MLFESFLDIVHRYVGFRKRLNRHERQSIRIPIIRMSRVVVGHQCHLCLLRWSVVLLLWFGDVPVFLTEKIVSYRKVLRVPMMVRSCLIPESLLRVPIVVTRILESFNAHTAPALTMMVVSPFVPLRFKGPFYLFLSFVRSQPSHVVESLHCCFIQAESKELREFHRSASSKLFEHHCAKSHKNSFRKR